MEGARVAAACHGAGAFQVLLPATLPEYAGMNNSHGILSGMYEAAGHRITPMPYCAWLQCTLHMAKEDPPQVLR